MPKLKPLSFRPDAVLEERVRRILDATGLTSQDLLDKCVRRAADEVASEVLAERRKAEALYLSEYRGNGRSSAKLKKTGT